MLLSEWNMKDALEVAKEEGIEEGMEKGMEKVFALLEEGTPLAEAKKKLGFVH
jgi:flagellar biosynthesis/type III secretory pathway protein FliH